MEKVFLKPVPIPQYVENISQPGKTHYCLQVAKWEHIVCISSAILPLGPLWWLFCSRCSRTCILNVSWHRSKWKPSVFISASSGPERRGVIDFSCGLGQSSKQTGRESRLRGYERVPGRTPTCCPLKTMHQYRETSSVLAQMFDFCFLMTPKISAWA